MNIISDKASIYADLEMGDNVRIDDFCILTGKIKLGSNIHIGCYTFLAGQAGIEFEDYSSTSPRCTILSTSDDYSGESLTNPTIPEGFRPKLNKGKITIKRHAIIGAGTVVLPGVTIGTGCSIGALSLINKDLKPWGIYVGVPAKLLIARSKDLLELEIHFENYLRRRNRETNNFIS